MTSSSRYTMPDPVASQTAQRITIVVKPIRNDMEGAYHGPAGGPNTPPNTTAKTIKMLIDLRTMFCLNLGPSAHNRRRQEYTAAPQQMVLSACTLLTEQQPLRRSSVSGKRRGHWRSLPSG